MSDEVREPEETQPGLGQLREAVARYLPWRLPERTSRRRDAIAGLNLTIANVPDGLANGVLAGVNPVFATEERDAPRELASHRVTVLQVYGNLFYAGANTLGSLLPEPRRSRSPVVVLRLRTRTRVGATLVDVLARYAEELRRCDGRLYLAGIDPDAGLTASEKLRRANVEIFEATPVLGESVGRAVASAQSWLVEREARA